MANCSFANICSGTIPTVPLNYAVLSMESPFDRNIVEGCVHEIITSVARAVISQKNVELVFSGIGRLQIRNTRAKLKFYKDFIKQMDGTGELLDSMRNVILKHNLLFAVARYMHLSL